MSGPDRSTTEAEAIAKLDPRIQQPLHAMGWTSLHPIQVASIGAIYNTDHDLILSAQTAAGKTEAAFLPILSRILTRNETPGVKAIYAGPLKALINDQFLRLERLCEAAEIPVHKWHGDVGSSAKNRLIDAPSGVLLITPESIESLLVNHAPQLEHLFGNLEFAVIDEMHSFFNDERGAQLKSVIARVGLRARSPVRIVGLSATLGDPEAARRWLRPRNPERVSLIEDKGTGKEIKLRVNGYLIPTHDDVPSPSFRDIFNAFAGKTALIFGNSKARLEECAEFASDEAERRGMVNPFRIHHGSLSKVEREETEDALRSTRPTATFCSSTLEMGIDVGNVEAVGQVGAVWSVGSLIQRVGRSGRKDAEPRVLRMFLEAVAPDESSTLIDRLYPELLQGVAAVELLLAKRPEPPEVDRIHLSTFVQQILSLITETGGLPALAIFETLVTRGAFNAIDQPTFIAVLRALKAADLVEQSPEGQIILGIKAEPIVRSFEFYSAFASGQDYRVMNDGREIGHIAVSPAMLNEGVLRLSGRSWRVTEVDRHRRQIRVEPGSGGKVSSWRSAGGAEVHTNTRVKIREILMEETSIPYLDPTAATMLADARALARESGALATGLVDDGPRVVLFTWTGSRINRTLRGLGSFVLGMKVKDAGLGLIFEGGRATEIVSAYRSILNNPPSSESLAVHFPDRVREKYDAYLSDDLLCRAFACNYLDMDGALSIIKALT